MRRYAAIFLCDILHLLVVRRYTKFGMASR